jgi:hypothetical protein
VVADPGLHAADLAGVVVCHTQYKQVPLGCGLSLITVQETYMSKGMDNKKDTKKKPAKTLMEKRAAKKEKKTSKPFQL